MLEIVEDRYGRGATLITSQIPVDRWHDLIGDPTYADAILDRIIHNAHRLQLIGDSLRKQSAPKTNGACPPVTDHGEITSVQPALHHPGRLQSECPADITGMNEGSARSRVIGTID
jgi:IstB-like ATP binding protein